MWLDEGVSALIRHPKPEPYHKRPLPVPLANALSPSLPLTHYGSRGFGKFEATFGMLEVKEACCLPGYLMTTPYRKPSSLDWRRFPDVLNSASALSLSATPGRPSPPPAFSRAAMASSVRLTYP